MSAKYNVDEVLEMAAQIESRGAKFYRRAAKLHVGARELLNEIAAQEDVHLATFEAMRKSLAPNEQRRAGDDPYGDAAMYLSALVQQYDFDINQQPEDLLTGKETLAEIFQMAIGMEKDSIAFYLGLRDLVPPSMGGAKIDAIVKEEMKHIVWLNDKRQGVA